MTYPPTTKATNNATNPASTSNCFPRSVCVLRTSRRLGSRLRLCVQSDHLFDALVVFAALVVREILLARSRPAAASGRTNCKAEHQVQGHPRCEQNNRRNRPNQPSHPLSRRIEQDAWPVALHEELPYLVVCPPGFDLFTDHAPHDLGSRVLGLIDRLAGANWAHEALVDFLRARLDEWNGRVRRTGRRSRSEHNRGRQQSEPYLPGAYCHRYYQAYHNRPILSPLAYHCYSSHTPILVSFLPYR